MFPLHLYARVRISLCINAHETAGAARTRSSLRPLSLEDANEIEASDKTMSRERERMSNVVAWIEPTGRANARPMTGSAKSGNGGAAGTACPGFHFVQSGLRFFP